MKLSDLALGLVVLLGGVAIYVSSLRFSRLPGQSYGSETMPLALAIFACGLGAVMMVRAIAAGGRLPRVSRAEWTRTPGAAAGLAVALSLVVFYIAFTDVIGFVPVAVIVIFVLMLVMRVRPLIAIVVAVAGTIAIQQAFGRLLLVPLPRNAFLGFLW